MERLYLATPVGDPDSPQRVGANEAAQILTELGFDVYCPWKMHIPHAWDYPNDEWGLMVFTRDIAELDKADIVVVLSYGRESTAGTNWEAGYAYGANKKVIVVEMTDAVMSLMVANGRYATVRGLEGLKEYDFTSFPVTRTKTEQK